MEKMRNNPCNQCIVSPICRSSCEELQKYLNKVLAGRFYDRDGMVEIISTWVRQGIAELYNNDTRWRIKTNSISKHMKENLE